MSSHFCGFFPLWGSAVMWCWKWQGAGGKSGIFLNWETRKLKPEQLRLLKGVKKIMEGKGPNRGSQIPTTHVPQWPLNHTCTEQAESNSVKEKIFEQTQESATSKAAEDLTNGHTVWTSGRKKIISWPKLFFSSWDLRWNHPLGYFPIREMLEKTSWNDSLTLPHLQPIRFQHDLNPWPTMFCDFAL